MKSINIFIRGFLLILSIFLIVSCTADIRTSLMKDSKFDHNLNAEKGRELLFKSEQAHGINKLREIETYEIDFTDQYYGIYKYVVNPYPDNITNMKLSFIPLSFDGRLKFTNGKWKNKIWGIQSWNTYTIDQDNNIEIVNNKDIRFWIPTYQYFIEAPFRINEGDICFYAGDKEFNNNQYSLVFISWKSDKPQKDIDQYIAWINKETMLIDILEFTVRDESRMVKAVAEYDNYISKEGISFPSTVGVKMKLSSKNYMHKMTLNSIELNSTDIKHIQPITNIIEKSKH